MLPLGTTPSDPAQRLIESVTRHGNNFNPPALTNTLRGRVTYTLTEVNILLDVIDALWDRLQETKHRGPPKGRENV